MMKVKVSGLMLLCCFALGMCGGGAAAARSESEFAMGTICTITLFAPEGGELAPVFREAFERLHGIERLMSAGRSDSEISRVNQYAGRSAVEVGGETFAVVERALYYAELSGGAFDPTVGPLTALWGIGSETPRVPEPEEIARALDLVDWRGAHLDAEAGSLFLSRADMALDLGAIAKGYAAGELARIIARAGVPGAVIDLGGNIVVCGVKNPRKPDLPWRIGIQDPLEERGAYLGVLDLESGSVVSSGVYERYAEINGRRYHHILSTADGFPVQNGLLSTTIIAESAHDADALSTVVFALGYERGRALVEGMEGVEALFVFEDKTIRATAGALAMFSLSNEGYRVLERG
jgi:thiamine biosynthesis lipoprotein